MLSGAVLLAGGLSRAMLASARLSCYLPDKDKLEYLAVYGRASLGECAPRKCGPKFTKIF